jgi:outer membrane protein assembly factor BamB
LFVLALPAGARAWSRHPTSVPEIMVSDGGKAVFAALDRPARPHQSFTEIVKTSTETGRTAWRRPWRGRGHERSDVVNALVVMPDGDVVAGGTMLNGAEQDDFVVARLAAGTGRTVWRVIVRGNAPQGSYEQAEDLTVAPNGDVIAAGSIADTEAFGHYGNFAVVALDGDTGAERWRLVVDGDMTGTAQHVTVDRTGDVIVVGGISPDSSFDPVPPTVMKLAGATGAVLWQRQPAHLRGVRDMALDGAGDLLLAGETDSSEGSGDAMGVVKLVGPSGDTEWITRQSLADGRWQTAMNVVADGVGGVFAAGMTNDGTGEASSNEGYVFTVVRLDSATGDVRWRYGVGGAGLAGFARFVLLGPADTILAAGSSSTPTTCTDGFVVALDRASGAPRWSRTFDGSFATADCHPPLPGDGPPDPVDDDDVSGLAVDGAGRIVIAGSLDAGTRRLRQVPFLRSLAFDGQQAR